MRPSLRSRFLTGCLVLALAAVLVPAADAQKRGGTLTIVRPTDPVSLDPNLETTAPGAWVYFNMLEGLLTLDDKMQVKPLLATSYEVMSPTKVRFKLRPGVKFHDGTPFNAAAVKFTFDRALRGTPPARWASLAGSLDGAEVVDDLTVDVVTKEPYGPILRTLAMYCMGMISPTAVQKMGADFSRAPVGTGPFKFVEWKTNTHVIIERNNDYWGDKALVDRVIFKVVPEEGARMIALQTGAAYRLLFPSPAHLPALRKDPKSPVHETTGIRVVFAGLHAGMPPLDDVRVRQALRTRSIARRSSTTSWKARRGRPSACWHPACSASRTCSSTACIRTIARRPRRSWPRPASRRAPTGSWSRAASGSHSRGWPRAAATRRTARSPRRSRPCSRRSGSRRRCRCSSGPPCSSSSAALRSTTTSSRSAG